MAQCQAPLDFSASIQYDEATKNQNGKVIPAMDKYLRRIMPWLIGILTSFIFFLILSHAYGLRYENSDDILLAKSFMGFEGSMPMNFTLFTHTFLTWILYTLSTYLPGYAWFSLFQLGLLWLSSTVIIKSSIRLGSWKGYIGSLLYLCIFATFSCARLTCESVG